MKWLITGANGMLGHDLVRRLQREEEAEIIALSRAELDITDAEAVRRRITLESPDVIINSAAFTRVDDCEAEWETARAINGTAVAHLAAAANETGALLVQVSTDFVFDGSAERAYEVDDRVDPLSAYGRSKREGEEAAQGAARHQIVRTSWLFGRDGWNFVAAIRKQIDSGRDELRVVDDQRGKPTWTPHLADAIVTLAKTDRNGVFHYADVPAVSWFGFAQEIVGIMLRRGMIQRAIMVHPVTTDAFPRPARRPAWSVLSTSAWEEATGKPPCDWREGLQEYFENAE